MECKKGATGCYWRLIHARRPRFASIQRPKIPKHFHIVQGSTLACMGKASKKIHSRDLSPKRYLCLFVIMSNLSTAKHERNADRHREVPQSATKERPNILNEDIASQSICKYCPCKIELRRADGSGEEKLSFKKGTSVR